MEHCGSKKLSIPFPGIPGIIPEMLYVSNG